ITHVWPVFGEAPVPSTVSSYWRPEGVVFIFDSFLSAAAAGAAGAVFSSARAGSARNTAQEQAAKIHETAEPRMPLLLMLIEFSFLSRKIFFERPSLSRSRGGHARLESLDIALRAQVDRCPLVVRRGGDGDDAPHAVAGGAPGRLGDECK